MVPEIGPSGSTPVLQLCLTRLDDPLLLEDAFAGQLGVSGRANLPPLSTFFQFVLALRNTWYYTPIIDALEQAFTFFCSHDNEALRRCVTEGPRVLGLL